MSDVTSVIDKPTRTRRLHLRRMRLCVVKGPDRGLEVNLDRDIVHIGTHTDNDLRLTDDTVSRFHAEIDHTPRGLILRDLDSTNGSWIGDVRLREVYLGSRERTFKVGQTHIAYTSEDEVVDIVPSATEHFAGLVGRSVAMREVFSVLERVAPTDLTVLITGETGTGKELVSRALHERSPRRDKPLVVFDCGAEARNLIESELFGHERGAFTGAVAPRAGVFEQAHGGTIFLDELGELPLELQPTLLRVLEQRQVRRVGDRKVRPVDVRVVAATNRDLAAEVAAGRFREDLYYRLNVVEVPLPPLRDRPEDIPLLVDHILRTAPMEHRVTGLGRHAGERFAHWPWPGNVRELRNTVLRALPFCDGETIELHLLPTAMQRPDPDADDLSLDEARERAVSRVELAYLKRLLDRHDGDPHPPAAAAGMERKALQRLLRRHKLG